MGPVSWAHGGAEKHYGARREGKKPPRVQPLQPPRLGTHLLVDEPQWVLDVWALKGDGWGGALE